MVEDNSKNDCMNRRKYLSAMGSAGTFIAASGLTSASTGNSKFEPASREEIKQVHRSQRAQSIIEEINGLQIKQENTQYAEFNQNSHKLKIIRVDTLSGRLLFGEIEGYTNVALKLNTGEKFRDKLPKKYREIPDDTHPYLIGKKDGTVFRRIATDQEHQLAAEIADFNAKESLTAVGSDLNGFNITPTTDGDSIKTASSSIVGKSSRNITVKNSHSFDPTTELELQKDQLKVSISSEQIQADSGDLVTSNKVTTASGDWTDCLGKCGTCVTAVGSGCVPCYGVCAGSPTGWGLILCILCIKGSCEVGGTLACIPCFDCVGEKVE